MFFYNRVPLWLYAIVVVVLIPLAIYEYNTKTKKKYPGLPMKSLFTAGSVFLILSCFYRLGQEVGFSIILSKIINISLMVSGGLTVLSFSYMYYKSIKYNYITPEALDKLKRNVLPLLMIAAVLSLIIFIRLYLR